jgi:uncharacterized protein YjbI with pentapeptide repeats
MRASPEGAWRQYRDQVAIGDEDRIPRVGTPGAGRGGVHLDPAGAADVEVEDVREAEEIVGRGHSRLDWTRVTMRGCRVRLLDVADLCMDRARLIDTQLSEPDVTVLRGPESTWRTVEVGGGRIGAWDLAGGVLDAVSVVGAQLGYVNLRDATLNDVALRDCRIETLDLAGATARRVSLAGCIVEELVVTRADLDELDLRGCRLGRIDGVPHLHGAIISTEQLVALSPALAQALGITVGPWPASGRWS